MARDIQDVDFRTQDAIFNPDKMFDNRTLPASATTVTSDEFYYGNTVGQVQLKVKCTSGGTLAADTTIRFRSSVDKGGTKAIVDTITIPAGAIVDEQDLGSFIAPRETKEVYWDAQIVTTVDSSQIAIDCYRLMV